jgi:hypothetical protein
MSRVTLSRYLIEQTRSNNTPADLRFLIEVVARACKEISHAVSKGALGGVLGSMGTENVQGEVQKKLDVLSNEILLEANEWGGTWPAWPPKKWTSLPDPGQATRKAPPAGLRPAGRLVEHRRQRLGRHHLLGAALPARYLSQNKLNEKPSCSRAPSRSPPATPSTARRPCC